MWELTGAPNLAAHRRLPGGIVPPFESLGCFRFQEKNGSEAAAGGENSVNNSGKQPGSGRSQWELVGASWARCGVGVSPMERSVGMRSEKEKWLWDAHPFLGRERSCGVEKEQGWKQRDQLGGFR